MASGSDSSGSLSRRPWKHDVFLSFRGEDTRRTFTSYLFQCLEEKGVDTFIDDHLPRGEDIGSQLIDTIRSSQISVVIFSRNYANSRWCLQELSEIMECRKKSPGQMVLPVFYDVDPSDVRKQTGPFGEAFAKHEEVKDKETVARWRGALSEAGALSGWDMTNAANGPGAKIVRKITGTICNVLNSMYLDVGKYQVGLEYRMMPVNEHLIDSTNDVRFIVICGIGGIGKTTLAKAVYNQFFHTFEAKSFLANVGENSRNPNGLVHLQEQLLDDILKFQEIKVENIHRGSTVIQKRLSSRRVLVILDDVTHRDQLNAIAREREWFGSGSRIIITTRDPDTVKEIKADFVYTLGILDDDESLCLFSMHAFGSNHPKEEFFMLSKSVAHYCKGLPLALEILGAFLLGKSVKEWKNALDTLRRIPHADIQKKLEISYQALGSEKELFLDIACFFVGQDKDYVCKILDGDDVNVEEGLSVLIGRNLVKITEENELEMHDLIWDMGKEIVRRESRNPGERSRLFFHEDITKTLRSHLGTITVEGLALRWLESTEKKLVEVVDTKAFAQMRRLRLLQLNNLRVEGDYGLISKELRWLSWHGFHLNFMPDEFYMGNLVAIDMQYSKLQATWKTPKFLDNLKVLNLSHSHFLTKMPDFSKLLSLEELIMEDCRELKEVDGSIGLLERLILMNLKDCKKLGSIPDSICRLASLRILDISGCSKMKRLPDDLGNLESLTELLADGAPITHLPLSITNLKNLIRLHLFGYKKSQPSSISNLIWSWISKIKAPKPENNQLMTPFSGFGLLTQLQLKGCNLSDNGMIEGIGSLQSLKSLSLLKSNFHHLPSSVRSLVNLKLLMVAACPELEYVPDLPPSVSGAFFAYCPTLAEISCTRRLNPDATLSLNGCENLSTSCRDSILKDWSWRELCIPGNHIPEWFEYQSKAPSLSFQFPSCHELNKITISCVMGGTHFGFFIMTITKEIGKYERHLAPSPEYTDHAGEDHIYAISFSPSEIMSDKNYRGIQVVLEVDSDDLIIEGIGIHLEGESCLSCGLVDVGGAQAGPSRGGSSQEYQPENEPITEPTVDEHWLLLIENYNPDREP